VDFNDDFRDMDGGMDCAEENFHGLKQAEESICQPQINQISNIERRMSNVEGQKKHQGPSKSASVIAIPPKAGEAILRFSGSEVPSPA
jgi:hypothetical protein